jgi:hypothetical protein
MDMLLLHSAVRGDEYKERRMFFLEQLEQLREETFSSLPFSISSSSRG